MRSTCLTLLLLTPTVLACVGEVGNGNDGGTGGGAAGGGGGSMAAGGGSNVGGGGTHTGGGGTGTGGSTGAGGGSSGTGGSGSLIAADRVTTWHPGILSDVPTGQPLGADGLPVRTTVCATVQAGGDIQSAIDACPANQVVQVAAGTFNVSATIDLKSNVVLRGAGSGSGGTIIHKTNGGPVIHVGTEEDQICYSGNNKGIALTADAPKESTTIKVGSAASQFSVGDLVWIDQLDVAPVVTGDCQYFKRNSSGAYRSIAQTDEVVAVDTAAGVLTLGSPLHWDYKAGGTTKAEVVRQVSTPTTRWAGVEHLAIEGATAGYDGQHAAIDVSNAAYSWVKDVQTNQTIGGMHIRLGGAYRCVVRDSDVHHSANYGFAFDCYGVVIGCGSAETLVENNIIRYMNKPMLFSVSGGGNVVGYNYIDNAWADNHWQEVNVDSHCSYSHMELVEGNIAPHMGLTSTHGNAGSFTYFRNLASSHFASPAYADYSGDSVGNLATLQLQGATDRCNVVGNVLGEDGWTNQYENFTGLNNGDACIYLLGEGNFGQGMNDPAYTTLFRTGNYDFKNKATMWSGGPVALPPSLYLKGAPAWWPAGVSWPWVGPDLSPMVQALPAKTRSDAL